MLSKPKVMIHPLSGLERDSWINPKLAEMLCIMTHDERFIVSTDFGSARPVDYARNLCVAGARDAGVDWLLMVDNDQQPDHNPLDVLAEASPEMDIIGLPTACALDNAPIGFNFGGKLSTLGNFFEVSLMGAGVIAIRSKVWQTIAGPWFRTISNADELGTQKCSEDFYFCHIAQMAGFKLWMHGEPVGHLKTVDLTKLVGITT